MPGYFIFEYRVFQSSNVRRKIKVLIKVNHFRVAISELKKMLFSIGLHSTYKDTLWQFFNFRVYFNKSWHKITTEPSPVLCSESSTYGLFYREIEARKIKFQLAN